MLEVVGPGSPTCDSIHCQSSSPMQGTAFICFALPSDYLRFVATEQREEPPEISELTLVSKEQQ